MKYPRLDKLEKRVQALLDDQAFVVVTFADRSRRTMRLVDVIDLLDGSGPRVVEVLGEDRAGNGQLLGLIRGLVETD